MNTVTSENESAIRVLVLDENLETAGHLATFLSEHHYDVATCQELASARASMSSRRPHVLVVATKDEPHRELSALRKAFPRLPLVVVTEEAGQELLLDVEAFSPAIPVNPLSGLGQIESAVEAAAVFA